MYISYVFFLYRFLCTLLHPLLATSYWVWNSQIKQ